MNYTVYIRKQNWLRFEREEKKAELINNLLSQHYRETPYDFQEIPIARACCLNKVKPCKHWNWTGENYTNILTGEIREVNELQD